MGPTHRLTGALAGVACASVSNQSWSVVAMSGLVASATAHGWASPDLDQTRPWVWLRQRTTGQAHRMMQHRELTHWWGLPVLAGTWIATLPTSSSWAFWMLLVGWASHLFGDFLFGQLPLLPGGRHRFGLGLDTGGFLETGRFRGRALPFSPARLLIALAITWVLVLGAPQIPTQFHSTATLGERP